MTTTSEPHVRLRAAALAALLGLGSITGIAACSDEDGDGGETDEEIQDGQDAVNDAGDEVEEEVDAQSTDDDEDGE